MAFSIVELFWVPQAANQCLSDLYDLACEGELFLGGVSTKAECAIDNLVC